VALAQFAHWADRVANWLHLRRMASIRVAFALLLVLLAATAAKVVPAYRSEALLKAAAAEAAARAAGLDQEEIAAEIRGKAAALGVLEAAAPGAVKVARTAHAGNGVCAVRLAYSRKLSLYGLATLRLRTDAEVVRWFAPREQEPEIAEAPHETAEVEPPPHQPHKGSGTAS